LLIEFRIQGVCEAVCTVSVYTGFAPTRRQVDCVQGWWLQQRHLAILRAPGASFKHSISKKQTPAAAAAPEDDELVWLLAQLALDKAQQVLLVHARAVVDVRVNLAQRCSAHKP
jgi:hypothetical protein